VGKRGTNGKGRFKKGNPGKPAGAVDKTRRARTVAFDFINQYFSKGKAQEDWNALEPVQRWNVICRLLSIVTPKESKINLEQLGNGNEDIAWQVVKLLESEEE
jgi:hypothetical protein